MSCPTRYSTKENIKEELQGVFTDLLDNAKLLSTYTLKNKNTEDCRLAKILNSIENVQSLIDDIEFNDIRHITENDITENENTLAKENLVIEKESLKSVIDQIKRDGERVPVYINYLLS